MIEAALRKLDVPQRQVVMEVTIAEVTLTDDIQFGVDWLFRGGAPSGRGSGGNINSLLVGANNPNVPPVTTDPVLKLAQGFTYILNNVNFPGGIQAALKLLDSYGNTKVIANPHVAALDNQKAHDQVRRSHSDQFATRRWAARSTASRRRRSTSTRACCCRSRRTSMRADSSRSTCRPRSACPATRAVPAEQQCAPPISTRSVQTLIAVPTGRTMVMGGLINETRSNTSQGIPFVSRIPFLGGLFGEQELKNNRTELVLFITPRVVEDEKDIGLVIDDLRKRMEYLDRMFPSKNGPSTMPGFTMTPQLMLSPAP